MIQMSSLSKNYASVHELNKEGPKAERKSQL